MRGLRSMNVWRRGCVGAKARARGQKETEKETLSAHPDGEKGRGGAGWAAGMD